jgi:hypothetical protein
MHRLLFWKNLVILRAGTTTERPLATFRFQFKMAPGVRPLLFALFLFSMLAALNVVLSLRALLSRTRVPTSTCLSTDRHALED